jgi:hypothetical protein
LVAVKCLDGPAFLAIKHGVLLPEESQLQHNISNTPPQLVDATIVFVNFSTEKKDALSEYTSWMSALGSIKTRSNCEVAY